MRVSRPILEESMGGKTGEYGTAEGTDWLKQASILTFKAYNTKLNSAFFRKHSMIYVKL